MEGCGQVKWALPSSTPLVQPSEPDPWETSDPEVPREADLGEPPHFGIPPRNGLQAPQALETISDDAYPDSPHPMVPTKSGQAHTCPPDRSVSGSSACSSLAGSSQESDEVFSDAEKNPAEKRRLLRKTKSWKTFFTMVHWSVRRRSSWVQLAGHEGNFKPSERGQILKKFSPVEDACLAALMTDVLHPFVPAYHGVVEVAGERYIQMDDLLSGLDMPSIMDCKMGTRTYLEEELGKGQQRPRRDLYQKMVKVDPFAPSPEERSQGAVTKSRYMQWREGISSSATLGFRIEGVTIEGGAVQRDFKQTRTEDEIVEVFLTFTKSRLDVLSIYLSRLEDMRKTLEESIFFKTHEVIGSSLLFLHDRKGHASVWMIDFGKTLPAAEGRLRHDVAWTHGSHEDGYLIGLRNLTGTVRSARQKVADGQRSPSEQP
ncbi:inositol-trisphosphate 3-kinase B-like [Anolis sagrei]|uniref:inositol-trisphosphate 3-kinase B-like n=1 Tax=Anolis sagrei TaxID=38937 RepID=UPI003522C1EA